MKRILLCAALAAIARPLAAQTPDHPNLILSIQGGLMSGGDLWHLPDQLVPVQAIGSSYDTISIGRRLQSGLSAAVTGMYFTSPHLGYTVELGYYGLGSEGQCAGVGTFKGDSVSGERPNQLACTAAQGNNFPTSMFGFQGGLTYRILPEGTVSPYGRFTAGLALIDNSFVETTPEIFAPKTCTGQAGGTQTQQCAYVLLQAPNRPSMTWLATLAVGNTFHLSPGYNARLEVRDLITSLPIARDSGLANGVAMAKTGWRTRHMIGLIFGLDVILERSHRRRY